MWTQLSRCWFLLAPPARRTAVGLFLVILLASLLEGVGIGLIFPLIKLVSDPSVVLTQPKLRLVYDLFGFTQPRSFVIAAVLMVLAVLIGKNVLAYVSVAQQSRFTFENEAKTSRRLLDVYMHLPYAEAARRNSADMLNAVDNRVFTIFRDAILGTVSLLSELVVTVALVLALVVADPGIAAAAVLLLAVGIGGFYLLYRRRIAAIGARQLSLSVDNLACLHHSFGVAKEIRVLGRQSYFLRAFVGIRKALADANQDFFTMVQVPRLAIESITVGGMLMVMLVVLLQDRDVGDFMALMGLFAVAAFRLMPSGSRIVFNLSQIRKARPHVDVVYEDLRRWEAVAAAAAREAHSGPPVPLADQIRLEGVGYRYPGGDRDVLAGIDLTIGRGESVALVGPSGAGKTTLADVLLGLLRPTAGRMLVDGREIGGDLRRWQDNIGYVPQSVYIVDDTLRRNVALGVDDGAIDDAAVARALELAQLTAVVDDLPQGLDTRLGENGARLSGGQKQRVGIARALYHRPSVLVLDEATSALDNSTEREITRAIESLAGLLTIVVIAHRLSTVRNCDRVVLLHDGAIADQGSFDELLGRNADLRRLVELGQLDAKPAQA